MRRRLHTLIEDPRGFMELILWLLNSNPDESAIDRAELRDLVMAWQASHRDARKMLGSLPALKSYFFDEDGNPSCRAELIPVGSGLQAMLHPVGRISPLKGIKEVLGNPPNTLFTRGNTRLAAKEILVDDARLYFIQLLLNPLREKLSDRPCDRCDRYFLKKTERQTTYCSRKCGKDGTAAFATKKRLQSERDQKLKAGAELARKWITVHTTKEWKQWASTQPKGRELNITPKFLTRAVNKGELTPPKKEK